MPHWTIRVLGRPWIHVGIGLVVLLADLLTGPFLVFPILFVLPVLLCGWFGKPRLAYMLAAFLPAGRFFIAAFVERPYPLLFIITNALIHATMLLLLTIFVVRTARLAKELKQQVAGLVTMCAWSHTIEHKGEWISFEEYLKRHFGIRISHGISPSEAQKLLNARRPAQPDNPSGSLLPGGSSVDEKPPSDY